jgi:hypothetical protein
MISRAKTVGRTTVTVARRMRSAALRASSPGAGRASRETMASMITTPPSTITPKSTAPIDRRFADMPLARR